MTTRRRLPNRRAHESIAFEHAGFGYVGAVGRFDDGELAEVFLTFRGKSGSMADAAARDAAILASIALQHGAGVDELRHALGRNEDGSAASALGELLDLEAVETVKELVTSPPVSRMAKTLAPYPLSAGGLLGVAAAPVL
jgi:hypothetical protein